MQLWGQLSQPEIHGARAVGSSSPKELTVWNTVLFLREASALLLKTFTEGDRPPRFPRAPSCTYVGQLTIDANHFCKSTPPRYPSIGI